MKNDQVVGIGEALWDMLPEGRKIGGAPANFAYHMSQFGFEATAVSAVGRDPLGDGIVAEFDARGLHHDLARVEYPTGTVEVSLDAQGIPCYDIRTEVAWDHIPFTAGLQRLAARTRCICFGSLAQRNPDSRRTSGSSTPYPKRRCGFSTSTCGSSSTTGRWSKSRSKDATS